MLDLNEFAKEVHAVAVEHGWWEGEENNDIDTKIALIHAEWSEALEEYRAGRPMVWHRCEDSTEENVIICEKCPDCYYQGEECKYRIPKPEGIAVELVDGCIRIMDLIASKDMDFEQVGYIVCGYRTLPQLVAILHYATAKSYASESERANWLSSCIEAVREWLEDQGVDFEAVMKAKHAYNKTRSYRHGGKRC